MSRGVGSDTGMGAGGFVMEIVGRLGGGLRAPVLVTLPRAGAETESTSTGMATSAEP